MGIRDIDFRLCTGCGICVDHCPLDVLRLNEKTGTAYIKYLRDCQGCFLCEHECPDGFPLFRVIITLRKKLEVAQA